MILVGYCVSDCVCLGRHQAVEDGTQVTLLVTVCLGRHQAAVNSTQVIVSVPVCA